MQSIKEAFTDIDILAHASPGTYAALAAHGQIKRLKKDEHLFWERDEMEYFYFSIQGMFSLYKLSSFGGRRVLFLYESGNMLNEELVQGGPASIHCQALSDSAVLSFPRQVFMDAMAADWELCRAVMDSMAHKVRRLYRQLKNTTGSIRGDKKIAAKLWKLSRDHGFACKDGTLIGLDLSITYLADMLGMKRETVSRQMKLLMECGLVMQKNRHFIIPDRDKLQEYFKYS